MEEIQISSRDVLAERAPRLSLIIPTYNYLEGLSDCLEPVLKQLPVDCECIVVDDGSDGAFVDALKRYENIASNFKIIYNEHGGAGAARNTGIDAAKGRYVSFLDADDQIEGDYFEKALALIQSDADLYIGSYEVVDCTTQPPAIELWFVKNKIYPTVSDFADTYIRERELLIYSQCNKFYKREILQQHHLYFETAIGF